MLVLSRKKPKAESAEAKAKRLSKEAEDAQKEADRVEKERKKLQEINDLAKPVKAPPMIPIQGAEDASWGEFAIGDKIGWEVTKLVLQGRSQRITIARGMVEIKPDRFGRPPKAVFVKVTRAGRSNDYYLDPQKVIKVKTLQGFRTKVEVESYKVVFHEFISEPMKADGSIEWNDELEMILADSGLDQYVQIASSDLGFHISPTLRNVLILIAALGFFVGIALNGVNHFIPQTVIHWVPT